VAWVTLSVVDFPTSFMTGIGPSGVPPYSGLWRSSSSLLSWRNLREATLKVMTRCQCHLSLFFALSYLLSGFIYIGRNFLRKILRHQYLPELLCETIPVICVESVAKFI